MRDDPETDMLDLCTPEKREAFLRYSSACESPIERIALAALLASSACIVVDAEAKVPNPEPWEIVVVPQAKVPPYRLDFAVIGNGPRIFALECDGRDFHKNHDADNRRSISLAEKGVQVFRISGSALYRDPIKHLQPFVDMVRGRT